MTTIAKLRKVNNGYVLVTQDDLDQYCDRRFEVKIVTEDAKADLRKPESASAFLRRAIYARWANGDQELDFTDFYLNEMDLIIQDQVSCIES